MGRWEVYHEREEIDPNPLFAFGLGTTVGKDGTPSIKSFV